MTTPTIKFRLADQSLSLLPGLPIIQATFPGRFASEGAAVVFEPGRPVPGFVLSRGEEGFLVRYASPCDAYRAIGLMLAGEEKLEQDRAHESVGVMWDLSRNGVLRVEAWEELLCKFALLGINAVQLYMEDVYEIPGEPFFGYGRGAYTASELRRIDDFGHQLGIEVIPCIQTLGHLGQMLQWPPYTALRDVPAVMMIGEEKTRELVGRMLDQVSACFRTRTVHIGMDEAHGVGTGKYREKHGERRAFDILTEHLGVVVDLCNERGLRPMMWSDMFFRIGSENHDYYDRNATIPAEVASRIPAEVDLVYWDYYHAEPAFYEEWIRRHRAMGKEPIFAGGIWNWGRFWTYAPRWRESLSAGLRVAREQKLAHTLLTVWGDNGDEYHPASVLPAVQYFAEWAYGGEPDDRTLDRHFSLLVPKGSLSAYLEASQLDEVPAVRGHRECTVNPSKWILWHDPVLGFLDAHITPDLPAHYDRLARSLERSGADPAVRFAANLARALALKTELHLKARPAGRAGDTGELRRLRDEVLPECLRVVRELWNAHRAVWHQWRKPFGWEVLDLRYAGCVARLESLGILLDDCLENPGRAVPEWEFEPLPVIEKVSDVYFNHEQTTTPSIIK